MIEVTGLTVYPIKSCRGIDVAQAQVGETGFEHDREFMLIDEGGKFISQRAKGAEILASVAVGMDHWSLDVSSSVGDLEIPLEYDDTQQAVQVEIHGNPAVGRLQSEEANDYFSELLNRDVRLVRASKEHPRYMYEWRRLPGLPGQVAFGDGTPFLIASEVSLEFQHSEAGVEPGSVPMNRFRPNIVVDGDDLQPYDEDCWVSVAFGEMAGFVVGASDRCKIPTIIQRGARAGQQGTIQVKADFLASRKGIDKINPEQPTGRFFGQNFAHSVRHEPRPSVCVGDIVEVSTSTRRPNIQLLSDTL